MSILYAHAHAWRSTYSGVPSFGSPQRDACLPPTIGGATVHLVRRLIESKPYETMNQGQMPPKTLRSAPSPVPWTVRPSGKVGHINACHRAFVGKGND